MLHDPYIRIVPGAKTAVLMIHGICGTPNHFRGILPLQDLVPEDCSAYNMVLDGHCKSVEDFSHTSMKKWKSQVWRAFCRLSKTHQQVVLVAHSMGTLFSMELAMAHPEKIPFLFLINVPFKVGVKPFAVRNLIRLAYGKLDMDDPIQASTAQVTGTETTKKLWRYAAWTPRVVELVREMHAVSYKLSHLDTPCVAFQSRRDELVSDRSRTILLESGRIEVVFLPESTHFYYGPEDVRRVQTTFNAYWKRYL